MMKSFYAAATWLTLGLAAGVFYREFTKLTGNLGVETELSLMHTHILSLGMMLFLIVLALDAVLTLHTRRSFTIFFWVYNAGLTVTVVMLLVRGLLTLDGKSPADTSAAIPGMAGLGHILITIGLIALFMAVREGIGERQERLAARQARLQSTRKATASGG
ncbi:DUF2871 domain-containing protein [Micrococcus sp. FDAARGOS_333]|uniref:DUF2871 domain-containing protein n=1 Tax=Micrococcus sp. FDAARGOS_333 TaxID=1930558 RepID=UPI000B4E0002|nr:DUF2871 domain-containing protein [Micrococcus sp. FDAARGOS_333]PNL16959.1 DUF2871 domain-containing protein [Micrococcus sp. FDAARGOS_333]